MTDRIKYMKEALMCAAEGQINHLEEVDAEELGEVIDMIKDLVEAEYYCSVVKAMEEYKEPVDKLYYSTPAVWATGSHSPSHPSYETGNGKQYYTEREFPHAFEDPREGKSYRARRMYMEMKETHQDKAAQMKELEKYMQELSGDITDMIEGASPEERQYMSKKIASLATKILSTNNA